MLHIVRPIRRLNSEDIPPLRALWLEGVRSSPSNFFLTEQELIHLCDHELNHKIKNILFFGTFDNDQLIGFIAGHLSSHAQLRHQAWIGPVYVTKAYRNKRLGTQLMTAVLDAFSTSGVLQVELCVDETNLVACRLFKRSGFSVFGRRTRSVIVHGQERNDLLFVKSLDGQEL